MREWRYLRIQSRYADYVLKRIKYLRTLYLLISNNNQLSTKKFIRIILNKLLQLSHSWWWSTELDHLSLKMKQTGIEIEKIS